MAGIIGSGTTTFGTLTAKFTSEEGVSIDGKKVPAVKCTADDDTNEVYGAGNIPDFGQVKATIMVLATSMTELDNLIGTTATLTWESDLENTSNGTKAAITGTAIFLEAPIKSEDNGVAKAAAVFQWTTKPTYSNETV